MSAVVLAADKGWLLWSFAFEADRLLPEVWLNCVDRGITTNENYSFCTGPRDRGSQDLQ